MLKPNDIAEMERALADAGVTIDQFCADAGINRSTWTRWKRQAVSPLLSTWVRVTELYQRAVGAAA